MCTKQDCIAIELTKAAAKTLNRNVLRKKKGRGGKRAGAGRPRKTGVPRCKCKVMTLKRAIARAHHCG